MTMAKNEEDWIETSVKSVLKFVDEVVVADNGSEDHTAEIIARLGRAFPEKIRVVKLIDEDFVPAVNSLMRQTKYRWILRWHADFVAHTSGPLAIVNLIERAKAEDPHRYFCVNLSGVALDGDLDHQLPDRRDIPEPFLYTYSPWLRYYVRAHWEALHVPWFYQRAFWNEPYYFHLRRVKSSTRLLQTIYWSRWFDERNKGADISFHDFVERSATRDYGVRTLGEAAQIAALQVFRRCVRFDPAFWGDYPELLKDLIDDPPYQLVYQDGTLVGRVDRTPHRFESSPEPELCPK